MMFFRQISDRSPKIAVVLKVQFMLNSEEHSYLKSRGSIARSAPEPYRSRAVQ